MRKKAISKDTEIADLRKALIYLASDQECSNCGRDIFEEYTGKDIYPDGHYAKDIYMECLHCGDIVRVYKYNKGK